MDKEDIKKILSGISIFTLLAGTTGLGVTSSFAEDKPGATG
jgi:hypothetical protein